MDKHTKASVNRLVSELVGSSSGSALRRMLVRASPESLVPPTAVRDIIVKATRETFARSVAALSRRHGRALRAVRSFFAARREGLRSTRRHRRRELRVPRRRAARASNCRVNIDKRRPRHRAFDGAFAARRATAARSSAGSEALVFVRVGRGRRARRWVSRGIRLRLIKMLGGGGFEDRDGSPDAPPKRPAPTARVDAQ